MPPPFFKKSSSDKQRHLVAKYRLGKARAKALKEAGAEYSTVPASSDGASADRQPGAAEDASQRGITKKKKAPKVGAAVAARRRWEESQFGVDAAKQAEQEVREQQRRDKEEARKRRVEFTAKCNKRTKRGQPVLGFQVEKMLETLQRKAGS